MLIYSFSLELTSFTCFPVEHSIKINFIFPKLKWQTTQLKLEHTSYCIFYLNKFGNLGTNQQVEFLKVTVSRAWDSATNFWLCAISWDLYAPTKNLYSLTSFRVFLVRFCTFSCAKFQNYSFDLAKKSTFRMSANRTWKQI